MLQEVIRAGITSIAVVFIHSYTYPDHEQTVRRIAESMYVLYIHVCMYVCVYVVSDMLLMICTTITTITTTRGLTQISLSSEVSPMIRMVARGGTTCVDAYLTPVIKRYLASFCKGFDDNLSNVNVSFMQSDGGHTIL